MFSSNAACFDETVRILRGTKTLSPVFAEFARWLAGRYGITAINFDFAKIEYSPENRHRLLIIVESMKDYRKMMMANGYTYNEEYRREIAGQFAEVAGRHDYAGQSQLNNLLVSFNAFSEELKRDANIKAVLHAKNFIKEKYPQISYWDIYAMGTWVVVFYLTDQDIGVYAENGISESIKHDYLGLLKEYDEFGLYNADDFVMNFDSKENVDNNFQGNLYFYFK